MPSNLAEQFNISALARRHGVSRATIRRRMASGWQPPIIIDAHAGEDDQTATLAIPLPSTSLDRSTGQNEIVEQNQIVATGYEAVATPWTSTPPATPGHCRRPLAAPAVAATPGRRWRAVGRGSVGLAVVTTGAFIAYTSMRANSWFGHSLTPDPVAGEVYARLSVAAEILACLIPTGIRFY